VECARVHSGLALISSLVPAAVENAAREPAPNTAKGGPSIDGRVTQRDQGGNPRRPKNEKPSATQSQWKTRERCDC